MASRNYSSVSPNSELAVGASQVDTTITLAHDASLFPPVPFTLIVNADTVDEEIVEVTAKAGFSFTVTRGVDGSSAKVHAAGAPVIHGVSGRDFQESRAHEAASTGVHGIADTSLLETAAGAQAKADAAQSAAEATASADATVKANAAQSAAQTYADGLAMNYDAAGSAAAAQAAAQSYADGLAANYDPAGSAAAAQAAAEFTAAGALSAHESDTTNVHGIADTSLLETTTGAQAKADAAAAASVAKSVFTDKGSLLAASAASTPANLPVGTDGQVLVADSNETTGLRWATLADSDPIPLILALA